jgi:hypothetical protein
MGKFSYNSVTKVDIEDRALAHLQLAMTAKLRRIEPFVFTWKDDASIGGGRSSVWIHPSSLLYFKYFGGREPRINRAWVDALVYTANQPSGLYLVPEPGQKPAAPTDKEVVE